jgi:sugar/nucleoside kinase (ribokinase family)
MNNMIYDFIAIGGITRDISFFTDQGVAIDNHLDIFHQNVLAFESGAKIKVGKFYYFYGGGASNSAVSLASLSLKVACLAAIGNDNPGKLIKRNLRENRVNTSLIQTIKNEESGFSFILISSLGERIIFAQRGANTKLRFGPSQLNAIRQAKNIYLTSLSGNWLPELKSIFSVVKANKGPRVFWNPGMLQYLSGVKKIAPFLKKTSVLATNKDEAIEFVMTSDSHCRLGRKFLNNPENLIKIIYSFGPKIVVITMGAKGVMVYDGKKIYRRQIIKKNKTVDTTGIGDAFNSAFSAGMILFSDDIDKSLDLALLSAASRVEHIGAQNNLLKYSLALKKELKKYDKRRNH